MQVKNSEEVNALPMETAPGVTVRGLWTSEDDGTSINLRMFEVDPGASTPRDSYGHEREIYVLQGTALLQGPSERHELNPGATALIEPLEEHQVLNQGEQPLRFLSAVPLLSDAIGISAQVSLYPLRQRELGPAIDMALTTFRQHGLEVSPGPMSTMVSGSADVLFRALQEAFSAAAAAGDVVMSVTFSNACPVPPRADGSQSFQFEPIGHVRSAFEEPTSADVLKGEEAELVLKPELEAGLEGLQTGDHIQVLFGFHLSHGYELTQHPRGDKSCPKRGVFALRSPNRPSPIGVSEVAVVGLKGNVITVRGLDALNQSPIFDIKPA